MDVSLDLAALVRAHQTGVWRYLRALGADAPLADDLTQETFLAVHRKPFEQRDAASTAAYLRTVARHLLISARRREARGPLPAPAELDVVDADWARLAAATNGDDLLEHLRSCLQTLDEHARRALDMQVRDDASREAIAAALAMTADGVKTLLRRSRATLRECIERRAAQ